jgi:Fe2+ or Zn2+ uptake regulation protein
MPEPAPCAHCGDMTTFRTETAEQGAANQALFTVEPHHAVTRGVHACCQDCFRVIEGAPRKRSAKGTTP